MACRKPNTFLFFISIGIDNHFEIVCSDAVRSSSNSVRRFNLLDEGDVLGCFNVKNEFLDPKNVQIDICSIIFFTRNKDIQNIIKCDQCSLRQTPSSGKKFKIQ